MNTKNLKEGDNVILKARVMRVDRDGFRLESTTGMYNEFCHDSGWDVTKVKAPVAYYHILYRVPHLDIPQVSGAKYRNLDHFYKCTTVLGLQILESTKEVQYE